MSKSKQIQNVQKPFNTSSIVSMYLTAIILRYLLILSKYQQIIANHVEVSTPLNSWKRVLEGLYLQSTNINPYGGDLLHETPLSLLFYRTLIGIFPVKMVFIAFDIGTAIALHQVAKCYMQQLFKKQEEEKSTYADDCGEFMLSGLDMMKAPVYVAGAFLYNPYTILNCVGYSTTTFHNFFLALTLCAMVHRNLLSTTMLAICTMISFYPVVLIVPVTLHFYTIYRRKTIPIVVIFLFISQLALLSYISFNMKYSEGFITNVYGFILTVPDLQPNIGLFWYFFTEMFDHFRDLFIYSFQINVTILYLVPLSLKFRKDPFLLTTALLFLITIFKSYPSIGDVGFVLSLLPSFIHLFSCSQQGFLVGVIYLITSVLGPILWYLWIYSNSANANFYFGVTLAFAIGQIFFLTDILFAYLKREFCLKFGKERKIDGKDALLVLE